MASLDLQIFSQPRKNPKHRPNPARPRRNVAGSQINTFIRCPPELKVRDWRQPPPLRLQTIRARDKALLRKCGIVEGFLLRLRALHIRRALRRCSQNQKRPFALEAVIESSFIGRQAVIAKQSDHKLMSKVPRSLQRCGAAFPKAHRQRTKGNSRTSHESLE